MQSMTVSIFFILLIHLFADELSLNSRLRLNQKNLFAIIASSSQEEFSILHLKAFLTTTCLLIPNKQRRNEKSLNL